MNILPSGFVDLFYNNFEAYAKEFDQSDFRKEIDIATEYEKLSRIDITSVGNWKEIDTSISPSKRYVHGLAYDFDRNVAILFGGDGTGYDRLNDTWEYSNKQWRQVFPLQSPPGRVNIDQSLVYDSFRKKVILFGGLGSECYLNDTWEYDGSNWSQIFSGISPEERDSHAMVFDNNRKVTVLFGGFNPTDYILSDTWEYSGTWKKINTSQSPTRRIQHSMAYDSNSQKVVLFGGFNDSGVLNDTWEYNGYTWNQVITSESPPARHNHGITYNEELGVSILFGGEGENGLLNDTWIFDGENWQEVMSNQSPNPRTEIPMIYEKDNYSSIIFGGGFWTDGSLKVYDDTWEFFVNSSNKMNRKVLIIVYDPILSNGEYLSDYLGWEEHTELTEGTIEFFKKASNGFLNYSVEETIIVTDGWPEKIDGYKYSETEYLSIINGKSEAHNPDNVDYNKIVNSEKFNICEKVNSNEIDEIWIYNGPSFGFWESTLVGPNGYFLNSPPIIGDNNCSRLVPLMGPSQERELDCAIHNFGHRMESTMMKIYGGWEQNRTSNNWEKFALVETLSPSYNYSGCGNIHYPPNGTADYDYSNPSYELSNCDDFNNFPNLSNPLEVVHQVSCLDWECTQLGFLEYWFSHIPKSLGCGLDYVANNWWIYMGNHSLANNPFLACVYFNDKTYLPLLIK